MTRRAIHDTCSLFSGTEILPATGNRFSGVRLYSELCRVFRGKSAFGASDPRNDNEYR